MSIETDIKQLKPFRNSYHKAIVNIFFTNNWLENQQMLITKKYGITTQQYNVLRILRGQFPNPITVNGIIERMLDKMSNASRLVDKLLAKDLVKREEKKEDRRACDIMITEKGLNILREIEHYQLAIESSFDNLSESEAEQLSNLLDKLRGSV